ncbi:MAG: DUF4864 domain-containing protein [Gemmobacter sp.]|nr:DUF4864 domain-containing protein [Gemmobacter sp.]
MKRYLFGCTLALAVLAGPVVAQETAIQGVISGQVTAFLADDYTRAFDYASPTIKNMFGTAERFGQMVQQGYPMVHRPKDMKFLELRDVSGRLWQKVMVTDAAGALHFLDYQMIETADGWQINAVQLLAAPQVGA